MSRKKIRRRANIPRVIKLSDEARDVIRRQLARFEEKFGRQPSGDEPIFFNPEEDVPTPIDPDFCVDQIASAMERAGIDPAYVYAFRATDGVMPTEHNKALLPREYIDDFNEAYDYYRSLS
jgi:site-specific recombinase XerD